MLSKEGGSTLLIGHRVALIRQSCARLDLECYLRLQGPSWRGERLGICLDSLQRLKGQLDFNTFKTIVIDGSEQVLSHFLSDTMARDNREAIFVIFKSLLRRARRVIALDADLGWLTFETLTKLINDDAYIRGVSKRKIADEKETIPSYTYLNERATLLEISRYSESDQALARGAKAIPR